jgi:hypothetical protein
VIGVERTLILPGFRRHLDAARDRAEGGDAVKIDKAADGRMVTMTLAGAEPFDFDGFRELVQDALVASGAGIEWHEADAVANLLGYSEDAHSATFRCGRGIVAGTWYDNPRRLVILVAPVGAGKGEGS